MVRPQSGYLLLEDGARFDGEALYGPSGSLGEAVFNTSHSGYQEILTDPSYHRQIMAFTMPHIGNVGVNELDVESEGVMAAGAVVRSLAPAPSNWRSSEPLEVWMARHDRTLLSGVDTRAVTLHLREKGAQRAGIFSHDVPEKEALRKVLDSPSMNGLDLTREVAAEKRWSFEEELDERWFPRSEIGAGLKVAVLDFGVKRNILRELFRRGAVVEVFPGDTPASELTGFDGILLSNGPGDPGAVDYGIETTRELLQSSSAVLYGICLGHQILSHAAGLETFKLRFGHRGANHPVRREADAAVEITSQNHGFAVRMPSEVAGAEGRAKAARRDEKEGWPDSSGSGFRPEETRNETFETESGPWRISHINLNDRTVEGLEHMEKPVFSIQYHPEASPGPHEGWTYFDRFLTMCREGK